MSDEEIWEGDGYPEPSVIVIDEQTDLTAAVQLGAEASVGISSKIRRSAIGFKVFKGELDFLEWQKEEPREIFEITPMMCSGANNDIHVRIAVTYNMGVID